MKNQPWMIFRVEGTGVHYIWEGKFPIVVRIGPNDGDIKDWYWDGMLPKDLSQSSINFFNDIAQNSRKRIFVSPDHKGRRMQVIERGIFQDD